MSHEKQNVDVSIYNELAKMCIACDEICDTKDSDRENLNAQCVVCEVWLHRECTQIDKQELEEQILLGAFTCNECLNLNSQENKLDSNMEDSSLESDDTMNTQEMRQAQFDQNITEDVDMEETEEIENQFQSQEKIDGPISSSPKSLDIQNQNATNAPNQNYQVLDAKMDRMIDMMDGLRDDIGRVKNRLKKQDSEFESYKKKTTMQLNAKAQQTVNKCFARRENLLKSQLDSHIQGKINECITKELDKNIDWKFEDKVKDVELSIGQRLKKLENDVDRDLEKSIEAKVQHKVDEKLKNFERRSDSEIDKKLDKKFEQIIDSKIRNVESKMSHNLHKKIEQEIGKKTEQYVTRKELDQSLDELNEKIWRRKNLLVVNLPESNHRSIEDRKRNDLDVVKDLFRKFIDFDQSDIEGHFSF